MSGHSKWATIHRAKEAKDAKRGAAFTKLAANITIAVKQGGGIGDPDKNFRLRLAVDKARQANMPKENITRAIEKGTGGAGGVVMSEATYEGFGPGGVSVMVDVLTDNKVRTALSVRMILEKYGGSMGSSGSVGYLFAQKGELKFTNEQGGKTKEEQELEIIESGVEEMEELDEGRWVVLCDKDRMNETKEKLEQSGYKIDSFQLARRPQTLADVSDIEIRNSFEEMVEKLEELDEVTGVWSNYSYA